MGISIALPLLAAFATPQSKPAAPVQQPVAKWIVEYADNSCHIARHFGAPGNPVSLSMKLMPGRNSNQLIIEELVEGKAEFREAPLIITTYPAGRQIRLTGKSGSMKSGSRLIYALLNKEQLDQVEAAGQLSFEHLNQKLTLAIPGIKGALAAATTCEDDLLRGWGIDVAAYRSIAVRAKPTRDPGTWVQNDDYPPQSIQRGERGLVGIRLDIATTGKVTQCTVIASSSFKRLDDQTCRVVMKRAQYEPARSADGTAIPSISLQTYHWHVWP
ncbi:MAG TPA: energy transducer TonB [Sphingomonas sp.]|nr:energy transducer TonB [Sphingomonas sp.]